MKFAGKSLFGYTVAAVLLSQSLTAAPTAVTGWPAKVNDIIFSAPAIGPHGEVVFGTKNGNPDFPDGNVFSINPNGTTRWMFAGTDWFESSPAVAADGTVYIGGWDNNLYAISGRTGKEIWHYPTGSAITAPPTIGPDGTIYIGSTDGVMYAIRQDGVARWTYEVDTLLSPVYGGAVFNHAGDTLYFGTGDGTLHAVDVATGTMQWMYSVPPGHDLIIKPGARAIYSAPAVNSEGQVVFSCENGYLYLLSQDGDLVDAFGVSDSIYSSPIIDAADRIYISSRDTYLYCVKEDSTGILDTVWEVYVGDVLYSTPAMDELGNIAVAGYTGDLVNPTTLRLVKSTGQVEWNFPFPAINDSAPNMAPDGSVCFGANNGYLYKLVGSAPLSFHGWPRQSASRRQTGWSADIQAVDLVDYFPGIQQDLAGLSYVPWYGSGWISEVDLPMINHIDHGNQLIAESNPNGIITYDMNLYRWVFASNKQKHHYYDLSSGKWLYHAIGTTVNDTRWYWDYSQNMWITEHDLD